ncbi:ABC-F family ATP-binding cassette domain-containing protein [Luteipulveratus mongoliensis]|uniref:Antibiotic ABC transporter ATP-binding protein n=1 Tax=Luteipulveratus mongoliensis TaxID=571913 RepID=A0A0K1JEX1_9MICO|nr:ABC-F family ATP-binding cassette domain-containing protein [Luteipulveratus mongoliensis]AKU15262.1 antibiotic ABC transporter ATP-binding protein [Luteipulveratus mongoliensis]
MSIARTTSGPSSATSLVIRDITKSYDTRVILDGIDLTVHPGQRVGLVGENGAGKSTLIRIVTGREPADGGEVVTPDDLGYLAQDSGLDLSATVGQVLKEALAPLHDAVRRLEVLAADLTDPAVAQEYDDVLSWATMHDAWDADRRAAIAAQRLGLEKIEPDRIVSELSGGQRTRLALAALLTRQPECVVLDEPTNHLDDDALDFLESQLIQLPGIVLVASHDRVFLDRACTAVVDLDPAHLGTDGDGGRRFTGNYTAYLGHKRASRRRWEEAFLEQQEELNLLRAKTKTTNLDIAHNRGPRDNDKFIYKFKGANVQTAVRHRIRDAEQKIALIERELIPKPPAPLEFSGSFEAKQAGSVSVRDLVVRDRVSIPRLDVGPSEHLLITGPNGCGKSTLLAVLAGRIAADAGSINVQARRVGFLEQDVVFAEPRRTPREEYDAAAGPLVPLGDLGLLHPRDLGRPIGDLSEGQQRRLTVALIIARQPDLLLLDEVTNHLSLSLVEELESALVTTPATVIVASHDRWLRRRWVGTTLPLAAAVPR